MGASHSDPSLLAEWHAEVLRRADQRRQKHAQHSQLKGRDRRKRHEHRDPPQDLPNAEASGGQRRVSLFSRGGRIGVGGGRG